MRTALSTRRAGLLGIGPVAVLLVCGFGGLAFAQAPCTMAAEELVEFNQGVRLGGNRGKVFATIEWDPDGSGSETQWLVIGGEFDRVQGVAAKNVAAWDGERWRSFNVNFESSTRVTTLVIHEGALIAAGMFGAAELDGGLIELVPDGWRLLGGQRGPLPRPFGHSDPIEALLSHEGSLYVGGPFLLSVDGELGSYVVRWDGSSYRTTGLTGITPVGPVRDLAVYRGEVYATGMFNPSGFPTQPHIARFDGESWHHVSGGFSSGGVGFALATFDGRLYVGRGGAGVGRLSAWDGESWMDVGGPLGSFPVHSLIVHGETLVGSTKGFGSIPPSTHPVYGLGESGWVALEPGISPSFVGDAGTVFALSHHRGDLIAGGDRYRIGATRHAGGMARLVDGMWTTVDHTLDSSVLSLLPMDDGILATGMFTSIGGVFSPGVALLTPEGVEAVESPVRFIDYARVRVRSAARWGDRLALVGNFISDGSDSMGVVIREGDGTWHVPEHSFDWFDGWRAVGVGDALYVLANIAGASSGTRSVVGWRDGEWGVVAQQSGLSAISAFGDSLVVAGSFSSIGGVSAASIARYDNSTWSEMGGGLSGSVWGLAAHRGTLLATGAFTIVDTGEAASIARWDGAAWHRVTTPEGAQIEFVTSTESGLVAATRDRTFVLHGGRWVEITGLRSERVVFGAATQAGSEGSVLVALGLVGVNNIDFGAPFSVALPCEADLNCDGEGDILDFLEFLQAYADCDMGDAACDAIRADFDQNGVIDIMDVMAFLDAFGAGCE